MKYYSILATFLFTGLFPQTIFAQWQLSKTTGSQVWGMTRMDTTVLAGDQGGIHFSGDHGATWLFKSCPGNYVRNILIIDSVIFITSDYNGIHRSYDNGLTWIKSDSGIANTAQVWSLAHNDSLLITGTSGSFAGDTASIYISSDQGLSWTKVLSLTSNHVIYSFAISGNEVFAGVLPSGLYYSNDKGVNWTLHNGTIPAKHLGMAGSNLLCGITGGTGGIELSDDKGITWSSVLPLYYGYSFATYGNYTFAGNSGGFYYSTDDGYTWTAGNNGLPSIKHIISIEVVHPFIFIGTDQGEIYKRELGDFLAAISGVPGYPTLQIFPNPSDGRFNVRTGGNIKNGIAVIYNLQGECIYYGNTGSAFQTEINLKEIPPGMYSILVYDENHLYSGKLIIR